MTLQLHVAGDISPEQGVMRERGAVEAGMDLARDRTAANRFTTFEDEWLQSGLCEIEGSNEAVVAGADDDNAFGSLGQDATSSQRGFSSLHCGLGRP
jgi:hypothetical protein